MHRLRLIRQRRAEARKRVRDDGYADIVNATKPVSLTILMEATQKPENTSDVRWRIELRRRAMLKRYGCHCLDAAPDPDMLGN